MSDHFHQGQSKNPSEKVFQRTVLTKAAKLLRVSFQPGRTSQALDSFGLSGVSHGLQAESGLASARGMLLCWY